MKKKSRSLVWILLSVFLLTGIAGCQKQGGTVTDATETESGQITTVDDISGKRIGVQLGTTGDIYHPITRMTGPKRPWSATTKVQMLCRH